MEAEEEAWEGEEHTTLKLRSRKGKIGNLEPHRVAVEEEVGNSEGRVFLDRDQGVKSSNGSLFPGEKNQGNDETDFETMNIDNENVGSYETPKHAKAKAESQSSSLLTFSEGQCENGSTDFDPAKDLSGAVVIGRKVNMNKMVVEMDVEKVLEEQDTHDLYCPSCNSCITKRIILRKRKQTFQDPKVDVKREKTQPLPRPDMDARPDATVANDPIHETEPDVFRCLSCFSFFIPTATGFKLFRTSARDEGEGLQSPQQAHERNLNCISSIFELFTRIRTGNEPVYAAGNDISDPDREEIVQPLIPRPHLDEGEALLNQTANTTSRTKVSSPDKLSYVGGHIEDATRNGGQDKSSYVGGHIDDATRNGGQDKQNSLVLLMPGSFLLQETQSQIGNGEKPGSEDEQINPDEESHAAHIESNKVESMILSPYLDRTVPDENSAFSLFPSILQPDNLKINGGNEVKDAEKKPLEDDKDIMMISTNPEALLQADAEVDIEENLVEAPKTIAAGTKTMQSGERNKLSLFISLPYLGQTGPVEGNGTISTIQNGQILEKPHISGGKLMDNPVTKPLEDKNANLILPKPEALVSGERKIDIGEIVEHTPNYDLVVAATVRPVEGTTKPELPVPSQSKETVFAMAAPELLPVTEIDMGKQRVDGAITRELDILKSIVYGGLIESIISLGVVSSAAGSDATTLNIVCLGVANLITGLFVLVHNLRELKNDPHSSVAQGGKLDRYEATLGQRENFRLHAIVAVSSYILFGLLPPVIYGFSFRKSDNKECKLIVVAAVSLLSITLLAAGKAHVREATSKRYVKTVFYYVGMVAVASGLSYVAGELLKKLLDKLGWFDSSAAASLSSRLGYSEMEAMKSGWAPY